jgi:hypothetical protein
MSEEIRITRGVPTDEELAAIVGVLMVRSAPVPAPRTPVNQWTASFRPGYAHRDGRPTRPAPTAWRASTLPRR